MSVRKQSPVLTTGNLAWSEKGEPYATEFDDLYFSAADGLAETQYVFIDGNELAERFKAHQSQHSQQSQLKHPRSRQKPFTICETGFGTGLNLFATMNCWMNMADQTFGKLNYISFEKHPLSQDDFQKTASYLVETWPELKNAVQSFSPHYPLPLRGFHQLKINDAITVTLIFDDLASGMSQLQDHIKVDAWFLDGFAPARNASMWQTELFDFMASQSRQDTTVATYTAAGFVRRGLMDAGFDMTRPPGFGRKRQMLKGKLPHDKVRPAKANWLQSVPPYSTTSDDDQILILGGGIAGCTLARHLADLDFTVTILDQNESVASGASGNRQAMVYGRLTAQTEPLGDFVRHALPYAAQYYQQLLKDIPDSHDLTNGYIQLTEELQEDDRLLTAYQSLPELLNRHDALSAYDYHIGGWLNPQILCQQLIRHPGITFLGGQAIQTLSHVEHNPGKDKWQLKTQDGQKHEASALCLCNSHLVPTFDIAKWLPLRPIRGQVSHLKVTQASSEHTRVICGSSYLTPSIQLPGEDAAYHTLGATLIKDDTSTHVRDEEHDMNWEGLNTIGLQDSFQRSDLVGGRVGIRAATPDYLPICGPLPDEPHFREQFSPWQKDKNLSIEAASPVHPKLFVSTGFGSRGFAYAPLCASYLGSLMTGEISPIPLDLIKAIHPARFLIRSIVKGRTS